MDERHTEKIGATAEESAAKNTLGADSVVRAMGQYDTGEKAREYTAGVLGTATDRREQRCVTKALNFAGVPAGAFVLDLPCGSGRLLPLLKKRGYRICGVDVSASMIEQARLYAGPLGKNCLEETDRLQVGSIFKSGLSDNCFDAAVCNRLIHYFPEAELRREALRELGRICRGPIVISFLCNWSLDDVWYSMLVKVRRQGRRRCGGISPGTFAEDVRKAGLVVKKFIPMLPLLSRRWYAVLGRTPSVSSSKP